MLNTFIDELELIQNSEVRYITELALEAVEPQFFQAAASSSGKYHPKFALGKGGLVRHTKVAVKFAVDLFRLYNFSEIEKDLIISALILHDTCKSGLNWDSDHTVTEHPLLVEQLYSSEVENRQVIWEEINNLIKSHMGKWNTDREGNEVLPIPTTRTQKFVHLCDYLASRKWINVDI